jgi:hypothetical protein
MSCTTHELRYNPDGRSPTWWSRPKILDRRGDLAQPAFEKVKPRKPNTFPEHASLPDLLSIAPDSGLCAKCGPLLTETTRAMGVTVTDHRDLIHPHRELRAGANLAVDEHTARALHSLLCLVLRDVTAAAKRGWIKCYESA